MRRYLPAVTRAAAFIVLTGCSSSSSPGFTVAVKSSLPSTAPAATAFPVVFTVSQNSGDGAFNPVTGSTVTVAVTAGGGTVNGTSTVALVTATDGSVSVNWVLGSTAGTQTLRAAVSAGEYVDVSITATAGGLRQP